MALNGATTTLQRNLMNSIAAALSGVNREAMHYYGNVPVNSDVSTNYAYGYQCFYQLPGSFRLVRHQLHDFYSKPNPTQMSEDNKNKN